MYSTPVDLSFSYLRSAVEASLHIKKDQVDPNKYSTNVYNFIVLWQTEVGNL